ncbi:hypothetical protein Nmel_006487 [Mimus melanotis]
MNTMLQNSSHAHAWDQWTPYLSLASLEPQKLELLGSVQMDFCVRFNSSGKNQSKVWDVSPHHPVYKNVSVWCNYTSRIISHSTNAPSLLPSGVFLSVGSGPGLQSLRILKEDHVRAEHMDKIEALIKKCVIVWTVVLECISRV